MLERISSQLGRTPQGSYQIVIKCPWGYPVVLKTHPHEGGIFPTLYWLSCPYLVKAVSRLEATGLVGKYDERLTEDNSFRQALEVAHLAYAKERSQYVASDVNLLPEIKQKLIESGIGGSENREGVKCLHMHLAHYLATGENPIGKEVWAELSPWQAEDCPQNCPPLPVKEQHPQAIIDAGSNTCRLLIAGAYPRELNQPIFFRGTKFYLQALKQEIIYTEAGRDLEKGRKKTSDAVEHYLEIIEKNGAELVGAVATGVWRLAGSPHEALKVIPGEEEARLSFLGAKSSLGIKGPVTVIDLGGGSLEIISGTGEQVEFLQSFPLGFWSVGKALQLNFPASKEELRKVNNYVKEKLETIPHRGELVVIGGTATTLAGIALNLPEYDSAQVHGYHLHLLADLPEKWPLWAVDRKPNLAIGLEILKSIAEISGKKTAIVSDIGLMGGIMANSFLKK